MWSELENALRSDIVIAHGATAGWAAWLAAELADREPLLVVVAPDDQAARRIEDEIRFFRPATHDPATMLDELAVLPGSIPPRTRTCRPIARRSPSGSGRCTGSRSRAATEDRRDLGRGARAAKPSPRASSPRAGGRSRGAR